MPRTPNAKSDNQLIVRASTEDERTLIRGLKEVCLLDGMEVKTEILKMIRPFLQAHNWPPGNPQTTLNVQNTIIQKCEHPNCVATAVYEDTPEGKYAKPKVFHCRAHHDLAKKNRLLRKSRKL